jgi:hypothetical protein
MRDLTDAREDDIGRTVAIGAYFGEDFHGIVDRLLGEQMSDGG